jgi:serine/threonine protein kinase
MARLDSRFRPGARLGHLAIERDLGRGAFGQVLLARDVAIGRQVVVKVVRARGEAVRRLGLRSGRRASSATSGARTS